MMKISTTVIPLIMVCFLNLVVDSAVAQTADQLRRLKAIKLPVVMPSYIPRGFRRTEFSVDIKTSRDNPNSMHSNYSASYMGSNQCSFGVQAAKGGWGAPGSTVVQQWVVSTTLFGRVTLEQLEYDQADNPTLLQVELINSPLKSYPDAGYVFSFDCKNRLFSRSEVTKILQSLQIKNP